MFSPRLPGFDPTDGADTMAPMVAILTLIRNRDCLTCYLRHRMERLENMRWDVGDMPEDQRANLSEHERTFADEYNKLLSARRAGRPRPSGGPHRVSHPPAPRPVPPGLCAGTYQIAYDVDITRDLEPPDDNLLVRVRPAAGLPPDRGGPRLGLCTGAHHRLLPTAPFSSLTFSDHPSPSLRWLGARSC